MRKLNKSGWARGLASILIALFAGPALFGWGLALPACAQITAGTSLELVAMTPFQDYSKTKAEGLGEKAASAVSLALLDTQQYEVRTLEETRLKMADLGLREPLDEKNFDRLGAAMGVGGIVFGEIRSLSLRQISRSVQAEIMLMVGIYDVPTRSVRAGTIITAYSSPAEKGLSNDMLIAEAVNQAAFQVVNYITSHRPLVGDVQWSQNKVVTINIGEPQGAQNMMEFVVLRSGQRVGVIEITDVQRAISDGKLKEGEARTGDKVRQIFRIEARGGAIDLPARAEKKEKKGSLILAVLALVALAGFGGGSGGKNGVTGLTAAAISNVFYTSLPKTEDFFLNTPSATQGLYDANGAAIMLRWKGTNEDTLAGYEIWRDGELYWFVPATGGGGKIFTSPTPITQNVTNITVDPNTGIPLVNTQLPGPDQSTSIPPQAIKEGENTESMTYTLRGDWYSSAGLYVGPIPGTTHTYQVRKVVTESTLLSDGTRTWIITRGAPIGKPVVVTHIKPVTLDVPANNDLVPDPTAVELHFGGSAGANDYIFQASFRSDFSPGSTRVDNLTLLDGPHSGDELLSATVNFVDLLGSLPSGTSVFWRIGARNTSDDILPLPYPAGKTPKDIYRYVFSETRKVTVQ